MTNQHDHDSAGDLGADVFSSLRPHLVDWDEGAWALAATAISLRGTGTPALRQAAEELLRVYAAVLPREGGAGKPTGPEDALAAQIAAQAMSSLYQATGLAAGSTTWAELPDEILVAQGQASAQGARAFAQFGPRMLPGLADRLEAEGARMLDVGVGVAALAMAFCEVFPALSVVGIDVLPRVLGIAAMAVADSSVADRVQLREQDIAGLTDEGAFDLVWLPAPFVPPAALEAGASRVTRALKPGGWALLGHARIIGEPVEDALTALKTLAYGGTMLDDPQAEALLTRAGLVAVRSVPTPPGGPSITVGQAPS